MEVGIYKAKVSDWGVTTGKDGQALPKITFAVGQEEVTWGGSFKAGKAREIAFNTLITCGFNGKMADFAFGKDGKSLNTELEVSVTVVAEPYVNERGEEKTALKVAWVNPVGSAKYKNVMAPQDFARVAAMENLDTDFRAFVVQNSVQLPPAPPPAAPVVEEEVSIANIPF